MFACSVFVNLMSAITFFAGSILSKKISPSTSIDFFFFPPSIIVNSFFLYCG